MQTPLPALAESGFQARFLILSQVHKGPISSILLAKDHKLNTLCALKLYFPALMKTEEFQRPVSEVATLQALQQSSYVTVLLDAFRIAEVLCVETEYMAGGSLRRKWDKQAAMDLQEAVSVAWQVAKALREVWEAGFQHLDIKADNIFLTSEFSLLKVGDFNSSLPIGSYWSGIGTEGLIAPELHLSSKVSDKADVWAYGYLLSELCAHSDPECAQVLSPLIAACLDPLPESRCSIDYVLGCLSKQKIACNPFADSYLAGEGVEWTVDFSSFPLLVISQGSVTVTMRLSPLSVRNPHSTPINRLSLDLTGVDASPASSPLCASPMRLFDQTIDLELRYRSHTVADVRRVLLVTNVDSCAQEMTLKDEYWRRKLTVSIREVDSLAYAFVLFSPRGKMITKVFTLGFDAVEVATKGARVVEQRKVVRGLWKMAVCVRCEDAPW